MGEIRLDHCCRLCLKEGFSLTNIFSNRSAAGDPLYRILNFIYEMKIFENDGLPSQICSPCMWRMIEFDACKKNVRSAEAEIRRLLNQSRPFPDEACNYSLLTKAEVMVPIKEESDVVESESPIETVMEHHIPESVQQFKEDDYNELKSRELETVNVNIIEDVENCNEQTLCQPLREIQALEADDHFEEDVGVTDHGLHSTEEDSTGIRRYSKDNEISMESDSINIKEEIVEWQMPKEMRREEMDIQGEGIKSKLPTNRNTMNIDHGLRSSKVILKGMDLEMKQEECELTIDEVNAIQSTGSSHLKNCLSLEASEETVPNSIEGESSSICTSQDMYGKNRDTNKGIPENHLRCGVVPVEESLSSQISKSILNVTKSGQSNLKASLIKRKIEFICDICKKSFQRKDNLVRHVKVHYDERPFSCTICDKRFKQDTVRNQHELLHHRDKMFGKSEKESKKKLHSCPICSKDFITYSGLWRHSNLHSDKHKCNICGRRFGGNDELVTHLRTHTKEKPFKCEVCFKCFSRKSDLNRHLLVHSSEKRFSCDICDKRFKRNSDKVQHELRHLRENEILTC